MISGAPIILKVRLVNNCCLWLTC